MLWFVFTKLHNNTDIWTNKSQIKISAKPKAPTRLFPGAAQPRNPSAFAIVLHGWAIISSLGGERLSAYSFANGTHMGPIRDC